MFKTTVHVQPKSEERAPSTTRHKATAAPDAASKGKIAKRNRRKAEKSRRTEAPVAEASKKRRRQEEAGQHTAKKSNRTEKEAPAGVKQGVSRRNRAA